MDIFLENVERIKRKTLSPAAYFDLKSTSCFNGCCYNDLNENYKYFFLSHSKIIAKIHGT